MRRCFAALGVLAGLLAGVTPALAQIEGQWTPTGSMQSTRESNAQVPVKGGKVLATGGYDANGNVLASAELYNATKGTWSLTGSMHAGRYEFPAAVLKNGKVLVSGGVGTAGTVLGSAELFDPKTGIWSPAGTLTVPRYGHTATTLPNGKVLVAGGCSASSCTAATATSELYDPALNSWSTTGSLGTARAYHAAVRLGSGAVLAIGGLANGASQSCELYDATTGAWSPAASTNVPRYLSGTTLLPDGKVLASGGVITKYPLNSAELYDPASNVWTPTASMATGRYAHASILLPDGTVVVAGGEGQSISCGKDCTGFIPTASSEIYTETTNAFTPAAPLKRAAAYQAATPLASGRSLVDGGAGYNAYCCQVISDADEYTPLTLSFSAYSLGFGFLQLGLTSPSQTITVTNASQHATTFTSITASGNYRQTNSCPTTLGAGQNCAILVSFTPTAAGALSGAIILQDSDPGSPNQSIALAGTGEALSLALSPANLAFPATQVTLTSVLTATLINDGAAPVTITGISIAPANRTFTQTNTCPSTLAVQQSCTLQIVFAPPDVVTYKATLSVTNGAGPPAMLPLSGMGIDGP